MSQLEAPISLEARPIAEQIDQDLRLRAGVLAAEGVAVELTIVTDNLEDRAVQTYTRLKQNYGKSIGTDVQVLGTNAREGILASYVSQASRDPRSSGVIVQLPIKGHADLRGGAKHEADDGITSLVAPHKDVDGLAPHSHHTPATALGADAILDYHVRDYLEKAITLFGHGKLVGEPLDELLRRKGAKDVSYIDILTHPSEAMRLLRAADIIIAATGQAGSLTLEMVGAGKPKMIIDAGTAERGATLAGDVAADLRHHAETTAGWGITPVRGGVGPLTVRMLHQNVITSAERSFAAGKSQPVWASEALSPVDYAQLLAVRD